MLEATALTSISIRLRNQMIAIIERPTENRSSFGFTNLSKTRDVTRNADRLFNLLASGSD